MSSVKEIIVKDGQVDPRIQIELETLNSLTHLINQYELELDDVRSRFRQLLNESTARIDQLGKKLGSCVEKARPYYESRVNGKRLQQETQMAALKFERACSAHLAAKEMVNLAEEGLAREGRLFDPVLQEMLNHAIDRVNQTESERAAYEREHAVTSARYNLEEQRISKLERKLKRSIVKSSSYYEVKSRFTQVLGEQTENVKRIEKRLQEVKMSYSGALQRLEQISESIHEKRKLKQNLCELRGDGVGEESPPICSSPRIERGSQTSPDHPQLQLISTGSQFNTNAISVVSMTANNIDAANHSDYHNADTSPHTSVSDLLESECSNSEDDGSSYHTDRLSDATYGAEDESHESNFVENTESSLEPQSENDNTKSVNEIEKKEMHTNGVRQEFLS